MSGESMDTSEKTYGGCEGPDAMYVKLISSDGNFSKLIYYLERKIKTSSKIMFIKFFFLRPRIYRQTGSRTDLWNH